MEIEQRYTVSSLHSKSITVPEVITQLASVDHQKLFDENRVKYWLHKLKLHRSDLSDGPRSGRSLPFEDTDDRILQV
jgi:hypothetical protein